MTIDDREMFYGQFLQHAVAGALQAINEATERTLGRPMSQQSVEKVNTILLEGLTQLRNMRPMALSPLDVLLAGRICAAVRDEGDPLEPLLAESLEAVRCLIADFCESLRDYVGDIRSASN